MYLLRPRKESNLLQGPKKENQMLLRPKKESNLLQGPKKENWDRDLQENED